MNSLKKNNQGRKLRFLSLCSFLFVILFLNSCNKKPERYNISEFSGDDIIFNFSKSLSMFSCEQDSVNPAIVLAEYGDLFFLGEIPYVFTRSSGTNIQFKSSREGEFVNRKISTLNLPRGTDFTSWFKLVDTADLSELEFLKIDSLIPENLYPYLTSMSKTKAGTGIIYNGDLNDISSLLKLFNPRYLIGETIHAKDSALLSEMTNLELLAVGMDDSVSLISLPAMPKLKQLILTSVGDKIVLDDRFLLENRLLEQISIMESKRIDFSILNPLTNLRELVLTDFDTLLNPGLLSNHKSIEMLTIIANNSRNSVLTEGLTGLRWITFSPKVTQEDFNSVINSQPDLEVAVIVKNEKISSLASLLKLNQLYGLSVSDTITDPATVKSLKNLKYLSLPASVLKDKSAREEWQKILPDTRISANEGFCLGSGWLLMIIPLSLFFLILTRKKSHGADASI